ncbi:Thoeris anti-defense Tad2 family protein [Xenorhabdus santafensis]
MEEYDEDEWVSWFPNQKDMVACDWEIYVTDKK